MSSEIIPFNGQPVAVEAPKATSFTPKSIEDLIRYSQLIADSGMYAMKKPAEVFAIVEAGMSLGFSAAQSLRAMYVVKGKPALSADGHVAVCLRSTLCKYFEVVTLTEQECTYKTQRYGHDEATYTFTMADAKKAGLLSNNVWSKYPRNMLRARAATGLARQEYPELVLGLYSPEELGSIDGGEATPVAAAPTEPKEPTEVQQGKARRKIFAMLGLSGLPNDVLKAARAYHFQSTYGVTSYTELTWEQVCEFGAYVKDMKAKDELKSWLEAAALECEPDAIDQPIVDAEFDGPTESQANMNDATAQVGEQ